MKNRVLTELPKMPIDSKFRGINWNKTVGMNVNVLYNGIIYNIKILDYSSKNQRLTIKYRNDIQTMKTCHFFNCNLGNVLGAKTKKYKYNIDDIIKNERSEIQIIEQIRLCRKKRTFKGYKYKCLKDGYVGEIMEDNLIKGNGCPVCANLKIIKGVNDIATTHPHLIKYFEKPKDAYTHSCGTCQKINAICPNCGTIKKISIENLVRAGRLLCPKCSDGISYPEKIMYNVLEQLQINFIIQLNKTTLKWCENYKYDFYIPSLDCIIETHGSQRYVKNTNFKQTLKEIQQNDKIKKDIALKNKIKKYIIINCKYSNLNYIKQNILNSELKYMFNINNINWNKAERFA